ncbi:MAG TPA: catalase family peroxidase [Bryobacteraceae bacterium]|jgi:catalase|nr:catalase family peroxidase [Bryobacteraceae bacterium]
MALSNELLKALDDLNGVHPGFRPVHAKGILLSGQFSPSPEATSLTRAAFVSAGSTPVTVRFSDAAGLPAVADADPSASPRGIAIRFHLAGDGHTDIVAHSVNGFPARTGEEFLEFLRAAHQSGPDAPKPSPIEVFLGAHPKALAFVQAPKPTPASFATASYFAVNAFRFVDEKGTARYGRFQIHPDGPTQYLDDEAVKGKGENFLFDDMAERIARGPVRLRITVQMAEPGDTVDDATSIWPDSRAQIEFGTIALTAAVADNESAQRQIIFDPVPRADGIEPSGDPLTQTRDAVYLLSGSRRNSAGAD